MDFKLVAQVLYSKNFFHISALLHVYCVSRVVFNNRGVCSDQNLFGALIHTTVLQ